MVLLLFFCLFFYSYSIPILIFPVRVKNRKTGVREKRSGHPDTAQRMKYDGKDKAGASAALHPAPKDFVLWTPAGENALSEKPAVIACSAGVTKL